MTRAHMHRRPGMMLVELLLVVAIIALVAGAYYGLGRDRGEGDNGEGARTTPGQAIEAAKKAECANNLSQLRMLIQSEMTVESDYPRKLNAENGGALTHCPVSGKPYQYDPRTGRVWCTTPGHENL
ncbi:MAG TPA: type II secretion system protein [Armatimonadota bacterium]|nr:type II secretion system protein [Armatimonadota bacterium]